uniref:Uncharacterized protein n=1 Tax=Octopus bimaculoides TaxID=37653 RepID=A0A0L8H5G1_OCTBM
MGANVCNSFSYSSALYLHTDIYFRKFCVNVSLLRIPPYRTSSLTCNSIDVHVWAWSCDVDICI